jgi:hypothetical protein
MGSTPRAQGEPASAPKPEKIRASVPSPLVPQSSDPSSKAPGTNHRATPSGTKHGLTVLKQAVKGLGGRVIDRRTTLGKALARWRTDLIRDIGGPEAVSTQQVAVVDLAVRSKLMLDSIDSWLLTQPSLVNARKRSLLPVVKERQALADGLARYMGMLGLERRQKDLTPSLEEIRQRYALPVNGEGQAGGNENPYPGSPSLQKPVTPVTDDDER